MNRTKEDVAKLLASLGYAPSISVTDGGMALKITDATTRTEAIIRRSGAVPISRSVSDFR